MENLNRAYAAAYPGQGEQEVTAVIFTHSHVDHFGGIAGLRDAGGIDQGASVPIFAPEGFFEEAVSENVTVGNAMGRRASYMYGPLLQRGPRGQVDGGLGKSTPSGTTGIAEPTCIIGTGTATGDGCGFLMPDPPAEEIVDMMVDGVRVQFQNVPGAEAPAEMLFYFPGLQALCASEDVTHTFHNVLTLRGANVRDSLLWAKYLHKTLDYFSGAQVIFASHHWPTWNLDPYGNPYLDDEGNPADRVAELIEKQRDLYRYIHDQSVRLTNKGYTIQEVGENVQLPDSLGKNWFNRSYYGTVNHNAKAVYQRYIGWFDGNPASLHQLPPTAAGHEYVRYMGGVDAILQKAQDDYDAGNYRWVAMVLNHVVMATPYEWGLDDIQPGQEPDALEKARLLLANTYDQLAYQTESGPWRNFYLTGAMELRYGVLDLPAVQTFTRETVEAMNLEMIWDFIAVHVIGDQAGDKDYAFRVVFSDANGIDDAGKETSALYLRNGVLNYDIGIEEADLPLDARDATMTMERSFLDTIVMGQNEEGTSIADLELFCTGGPAPDCIFVEDGGRQGEGQDAVNDFFSVLDHFDFWFPIVAPDPLERTSEASSAKKPRAGKKAKPAKN